MIVTNLLVTSPFACSIPHIPHLTTMQAYYTKIIIQNYPRTLALCLFKLSVQ